MEISRVEIRPPQLDLIEYSSADVGCVAQPPTAVTFSWTRLDGKMPSNAYVYGSILRFNQIRRSDAGVYQCTASNQYSDYRKTLHVYVHDSNSSRHTPLQAHNVRDVTDRPRKLDPLTKKPLTVKPLEEKYTVVQGSNFSLACETSKNPDETIVWTNIHEDSLQRNCQQIGNILKIDNAQPNNRGIYQCRVTSNGQSMETSTVIEIERKICFSIKIFQKWK